MISFKDIASIGEQIRNIYLQDENMYPWFQQQIIEYNGDYPDQLIDEMKNYLIKNGYQNLESQISELENITQKTNILNGIFSECINSYSTRDTTSSSSSLKTNQEISDNNSKYYDEIIKNLHEKLNLSNDVAYLLLKKYHWNVPQITNLYFNSPEVLMNSILIKNNDSKSLESPLSLKPCGEFECPICTEENEIYELYCGHQMCANCIIQEAEVHIENKEIPHCTCKAEIAPSVIELLIEDQQILDNYHSLVLKFECDCDNKIKACPQCNFLLSESHDIGCHTAKCPKCKTYVCLKCSNIGSHAPLIDCQNVNNFSIIIRNEMDELLEMQKTWFIRDEKLMSYRKDHREEFLPYFTEISRKAKEEIEEAEKEEKNELEQIKNLCQQKEIEINNLNQKLDQLKHNSDSTNAQIDSLSKQISTFQDYVNSYKETITHLTNLNKTNEEDRKAYLKKIDDLRTDYSNSVANHGNQHHLFFMRNFKQGLSELAQLKTKHDFEPIDNEENALKECPFCHAPSIRLDGCNQVRCNNCGNYWCFACGNKWKETGHSDHHECPFYKRKIENLIQKTQLDISDPKFYPPPMGIDEMAQYAQYRFFYSQFQKYKVKHDEFFKKCINNSEDSYKHHLIEEFAEIHGKNAQNFVDDIFDLILFAMSILAWGNPQLYFIEKKNKMQANTFSYRLYIIETIIDKIIESLDNHSGNAFSQSHYDNLLNELRTNINEIFRLADCFNSNTSF